MSARAPALVAAIGGAVATVAASFLPWLRSGTVVRSGFTLAKDAWGAGLADVHFGSALIIAWLFSPVAAAGAWTAAATGKQRVSGFLATATGAVGLSAAGVVLASRAKTEPGPYAAIFAGAVAVLGGLLLMFSRRGADE